MDSPLFVENILLTIVLRKNLLGVLPKKMYQNMKEFAIIKSKLRLAISLFAGT